MQRSTLLIGCGTAAAAVLERVGTEFAQRDAPDGALRRLLIVPGQPDPDAAPTDANAIQRLAVSLTAERVTALYYANAADDYAARAWSSVNWREWGSALPSLRLYGYLTFLLERETLRQVVESAIGGLQPRPGQPLQVSVYLVAHLHDPFASGMVGELAYLLYDIARTYRGGLSLLGVLPGTLGDPLTAADTPADTRLRQATAYAALRELNFFHSPRDRAGLLPTASTHVLTGGQWRRLEFSPFERGDLYLAGGRNNERGQPLRHDHIAEVAARWIYLHTAQPTALTLPQQRRAALITAFNVAHAHDRVQHETGSGRQQQQRQQVVTELLRRLLHPSDVRLLPPTARPVLALELAADDTAVPDPASDEERQPVRWLTITLDGLRRELNARERAYFDAVQRLVQQEEKRNDRVNELLQKQVTQLTADLHARLTQPGIALPPLQRWLAAALDDAARLRDRGEQHGTDTRLTLADRLKESEQHTKRLLDGRQQFFYWSQGLPSTGLIVLLLGLIVGPLAVLLLLGRAPIAAVGLLAVGIVLPLGLLRGLYTRRQRSVLTAYEQAQRDLLDQQRDLLDQRLYQRFYYRFANHLAGLIEQAAGLERCLRAALPTADGLIDGLPTPALQAIDAGWNRLAPVLLHDLWTQFAHDPAALTPTQIDAVVEQHAQEAGMFSQFTSEHDLLRERIQSQQAEIGALVAFDSVQVNPEYRERGRRLTAWVHGWPLPPAPLDALPVLPLPAPVAAAQDRELMLTYQHPFIPLIALSELRGWREAYLELSERTTPSGTERSRSLFHPTRLGSAAPDLLAVSTEQAADLPVIMIVTVLLRHAGHPRLTEYLCQRLRVPQRPTVHYDDLCGALQETPLITAELRRYAQQHAQAANLTRLADAAIQPLLEDWRHEQPRLSEKYADWEVWIVALLLSMFAPGTAITPQHRLIDGLYRVVSPTDDDAIGALIAALKLT